MTQALYAVPSENMDSRPRLELVAEPDFGQEFKDLLDYVQDAREHMGRVPEVVEAERGAREYAKEYWPNGRVLHITLPEGSIAYDHNNFMMDSCPEVFRSDFFAGFEMGKARFIDLATSRAVIVSDIRLANLSLAGAPKHEDASYE